MKKLYDVSSQWDFVDLSEVIYIDPKDKMGRRSLTDWLLSAHFQINSEH